MAETYQIHAPVVKMRLKPEEAAEVSNELLYGEIVSISSQQGQWSNVRAEHDGYEGFIPTSALGSVHEMSHKIGVPVTHVYEEPDCKSHVISSLYLGSGVSLSGKSENSFCELQHSGWVFENHIAPANEARSDFVETALLYLHAPYIWGGRTAAGIDCSGLVQISLMAAGIECPRDTCQQIEVVGTSVAKDNLQRGDLVYFKGHVGIMLDEKNMLNATARHMQTVVEPLSDVEKAYDGILDVRRL